MTNHRVKNIYTLYDDYATITLEGGKYDGTVITIDLEDVERCQQYHWCASRYGYCKIMYISCNKLRTFLHRFLMDTPKGMETDHKDGDTLNNRKYNLRICTTYQNTKNRKHNRNNTSGHKGVIFDTFIATPKWKANIMVNYKLLHLGYFETYDEAVQARLDAEKLYFGEFVRENAETEN